MTDSLSNLGTQFPTQLIQQITRLVNLQMASVVQEVLGQVGEWVLGEITYVNAIADPVTVSAIIDGAPPAIQQIPVVGTYLPKIGDTAWFMHNNLQMWCAFGMASGAAFNDKDLIEPVGAASSNGVSGFASRDDHVHEVNPSVLSGVLPSGMITAYGGANAPSGWLGCDGSAVSRTTYAALYAAIGTAFGAGDGTSTFNLPDLRGRVPVGADPTGLRISTYVNLGQASGEQTHVLSVAELASHTHGDTGHGHGIADPGHNHGVNDPSHAHAGTTGGDTANHTHGQNIQHGTSGSYGLVDSGTASSSGYINPVSGFSNNHAHQFNTNNVYTGIYLNGAYTAIGINTGYSNNASAGSGSAHNNLQPYQMVNYIIKT